MRVYILPNGDIKKNRWENGKKGAYLEMDEAEKSKNLKLKDEAEKVAADIDNQLRNLKYKIEQRQQIQHYTQVLHEADRLPEGEEIEQEYIQQQSKLNEDAKQEQNQQNKFSNQATVVKQNTHIEQYRSEE